MTIHSKYGYSRDHMLFLDCIETPFNKIVSLNHFLADIFSERLTDVNLPLPLPLLRDKSLLLLWPQQQPVNYMVFALNWSGFTCLYCELHGLYMVFALNRSGFDLILGNIHLLRRNSNEMKPNFCLTKLSATPQNNPSSLNTYKAGPQTLIYKVGLIVEFLETWDVSLLKLNPCL